MPPQQKPPPIRIRTADDLIAAWFHPEMAVAMASLKQAAVAPQGAARYFEVENRDMVGEMLDLRDRFRGELRVAFLYALTRQPDLRVTEFAVREFGQTESFKVQKVLAAYLLEQGESHRLNAYLFDPRIETATLVAAMTPPAGLAGREGLRCALLKDSLDLVAGVEASDDDWSAELKGSLSRLALSALLQTDEQRGRRLVCREWEQLPEEARDDLLEIWLPQFEEFFGQRIAEGRAESSVLVAYCRGLESGSLSSSDLLVLSKQHRKHPDPAVATQAWLATWDPEHSLRLLCKAPERVLRGVLARLPAEGLPEWRSLASLLTRGEPQVRGVVARRLSEMGEPVQQWARTQVLKDDGAEKLALVSLLLLMGDDSWLAANVVDDKGEQE